MPGSAADAPTTATFTLNGQPITRSAEGKRPALDLLREELGERCLKPGCSPQGVCGSCASSVDGKPRLLCTLPLRSLEGKEIITLEHFPQREREALAEGLARAGAVQCGYCIPGIVVQAALLLRRDPDPSRESVAKALAMHSCRCTGWGRILDGVAEAAALLRAEGPIPAAEGVDIEAREGALGERSYVDDIDLPGMLHGALLLTPQPRCRLRALDASAALARPGVRAVLTAADVPGERSLGLDAAGPLSAGRPSAGRLSAGRPVFVALGEETACAGDAFALVVAESREAARAAVAALKLEVEVLAPALLPNKGERVAEARASRGDVDLALDDSGLVLAKGSFTTAPVDPAYLEPSGAVATPLRGGGLHVWTNGEAPFADRQQLAAMLGLPTEQVSVEALPGGGAFGGKLELLAQPYAALAAATLRRPVKVSLDLDESARMHLRQAPLKLRVMLAAHPDGRFVGLKALLVADLGGRPSLAEASLQALVAHAAGPYDIPNLEVEARGQRTNNPSAGPTRGLGLPALTFAVEGCVDRLAEALGVDPLALRAQNLSAERADLKAAIEALKPELDAARAEGKFVGVACAVRGLTGLGGAPARTRIEVKKGPEVSVFTGFPEQGQGHELMCRALVAARCGLPPEQVTWRCDTSAEVDSGLSLSSRDHALGVPAVAAAAEALAQALAGASGDLTALVGRRFEGSYALTSPVEGVEGAPLALHALGWGLQAAVLDAAGGLERLIVVHDAGAPFSAELTAAQLEGAALMGVGLALSESVEPTEGLPSARYRDMGTIKAASAPPIEVRLQAAEGGELSPRGADELGMIPTAAAIAAAAWAHDGVRRSSLPMRDCPAAWSVGVRRPRKVRA